MTVYNPSGAGPQGYQVASPKGGPPHPASGNEFAFNRVRNGDQHTVRDAQTFLNHAGFQVGVDGIFGPQTAQALKRYLHGHKPQAVSNKRYVPPTPAPRAPARDPVKAGKGGGGKGGGKGSKIARGGGGGMP